MQTIISLVVEFSFQAIDIETPDLSIVICDQILVFSIMQTSTSPGPKHRHCTNT
jgi:hypothetical protein